MVDSCQEEKELPANCFSVVLAWVYSKAPKEAEPVLRRLIILIFAGWVPHDIASSWSCLGLFAGIRLYGLSSSVFEGSPGRGCAPVAALESLFDWFDRSSLLPVAL